MRKVGGVNGWDLGIATVRTCVASLSLSCMHVCMYVCMCVCMLCMCVYVCLLFSVLKKELFIKSDCGTFIQNLKTVSWHCVGVVML